MIVGMRGAGKTSQSRVLAGQFRYKLVDVDEEIERRLQMRADRDQQRQSIKEMVEKEGWDAFRALELRVFEDIVQQYPYDAIIRYLNASCIHSEPVHE